MRLVTIELDEPTILLNRWQRLHFRDKKRHMERIAWMVKASVRNVGEPMQQCAITVHRYSAETPDWDGLYGGLKPLLDCLVVPTSRNPMGLGLIRDDNPECVISLTAQPCYAPRKQGRTVVNVIEAAKEGVA